jgi:2-iminobutanoate/2-iminopropanoate deaminase
MAQVTPLSRCRKAGNLLFTSGQVHLKDGVLVEGSIGEQTQQVMENLKAVLEEAGYEFGQVVKATIYTTDMSKYGEINEVYVHYFAEPFPAREVIGVQSLPLGARVEISLVAYKE